MQLLIHVLKFIYKFSKFLEMFAKKAILYIQYYLMFLLIIILLIVPILESITHYKLRWRGLFVDDIILFFSSSFRK